jgi:predicted SnoaL-like aldol condensation-catalyzing enzyme
MNNQADNNKAIVRRFNEEVIQQCNRASFEALMDSQFINHSAPAGFDPGAGGMWYFFNDLLHPALSDIKVTILQQVAEGDLVTTHKLISGTHTGNFMGIAATGKAVELEVIDIVRVENEKYAAHWGVNTLAAVLQSLQQG